MGNTFINALEGCTIEHSIFKFDSYNILNNLLSLEDLQDKREKWTRYNFNGLNVPRVTEIISSTINKEYLNKWAAKLGSNYDKEMRKILDTGSLAHQYIEDYIFKGKITEYNNYPEANELEAIRAYHNFLKFWADMKNKGYIIEPIATEIPFATPWFGGTIDFMAYITPPNTNKKRLYILDFKTSKKISYNYFLQLTLYTQAYEDFLRVNMKDSFGDFGRIDGMGIIRVDKVQDKYEYVFVDMDADNRFVYRLNQTASAMVNWFYYMNFIESEYYKFKKKYMEEGGIDGVYKRIYSDSE